jgi:hypothetical protein
VLEHRRRLKELRCQPRKRVNQRPDVICARTPVKFRVDHALVLLKMLQLVPGDRDQNGLLRPPGRSTHVAVPVAPGCVWLIRTVRFCRNGLWRPDECTARRRTFSTGGGCGFLSSFRQKATVAAHVSEWSGPHAEGHAGNAGHVGRTRCRWLPESMQYGGVDGEVHIEATGTELADLHTRSLD